ncbi:MAG: tape measure protein [Lachnospiraceae bacterium]
MTVRDIAIAMGFKIDESSMKEAEGRIEDVKNFAMKALGAIGIGFSLTQMNALAEEFNGINDQIKNATAGLGEQKDIQQKIMQSANDTKMSYADTAKTVGALVQENRELFGSVDEAIAFHDALTKTFKTAGKSNEEIVGLMEAVNKSFAKGKVDTETLNQLMERSPEAVGYLNEQLGSTTDQLEQLAADGKISLADLKNAFVSHTDEINGAFSGLDYSISDGLTYIRNKWGYWLDDINAATGFTKTLSKGMTRAFDMAIKGLDRVRDVVVRVTDKLGGMENVLRLLGIAAGMTIAAFKGKQILSFLKSLIGLLNVANLKIMAIVAVILAIALVVDDFINFMKGNDSVIGDILGKMGYDVDEIRDRIITAWNKVKGFLLRVWMSISGIGKAVSTKLRDYWLKNGDEIKERLGSIFQNLLAILKQIFNGIYQLAVFLFGKLQNFWDEWGEQILAALSAVFSAIHNIVNGVLLIFEGITEFLSGVFTLDFKKALQGIEKINEGCWLAVKSFFKGIWDAIYALFGEKIDAIVERVSVFVEKIQGMLEKAKGFLGDISDGAGDFLDGVGDFFAGDATIQKTTVANAGGVGGSRTSNVTQNVNIEQTFHGTDQRTISQAAAKSATDTTDQLAKGLKYGT